jgi:hypothetical protein
MRAAVIAWGRARWPDARVMQELSVGGCRIDVAFTSPHNLIGIEIKSSRDTLERLARQMRDYVLHLPEIWIAFAPKWTPHFRDRHDAIPWRVGKLVVDGGTVIDEIPWGEGRWKSRSPAECDVTHTSPMLFLLLKDELLAIARQHAVPHKTRHTVREIIERLARALTGDQIVHGVCAQLRARGNAWHADIPIGIESIWDAPIRQPHIRHPTPQSTRVSRR